MRSFSVVSQSNSKINLSPRKNLVYFQYFLNDHENKFIIMAKKHLGMFIYLFLNLVNLNAFVIIGNVLQFGALNSLDF